jgi:hypothetical protein
MAMALCSTLGPGPAAGVDQSPRILVRVAVHQALASLEEGASRTGAPFPSLAHVHDASVAAYDAVPLSHVPSCCRAVQEAWTAQQVTVALDLPPKQRQVLSEARVVAEQAPSRARGSQTLGAERAEALTQETWLLIRAVEVLNEVVG